MAKQQLYFKVYKVHFPACVYLDKSDQESKILNGALIYLVSTK